MEFGYEIIEHVWNKAQKVENVDPRWWRKDLAGAWIKRGGYGRHGDYGWEINLKVPRSEWGEYERDNLIPLHWRNHEAKGENYPCFETSVTSKGYTNIDENQVWSYVFKNSQKPKNRLQRMKERVKRLWEWVRFCFSTIDGPV